MHSKLVHLLAVCREQQDSSSQSTLADTTSEKLNFFPFAKKSMGRLPKQALSYTTTSTATTTTTYVLGCQQKHEVSNKSANSVSHSSVTPASCFSTFCWGFSTDGVIMFSLLTWWYPVKYIQYRCIVSTKTSTVGTGNPEMVHLQK